MNSPRTGRRITMFLDEDHRWSWPAVATLLLVLGLAAALTVGAGCAGGKKPTQLYHCPMHPTYVLDHPGDCPICGMKLVPMENPAGEKKAEASSPTPGAASEAEQQEPEGKKSEPAASTERTILYYRSPMDPSVTSPVPAKDAMGMDFVPVYRDQEGMQGGVPGHAPITVSDEGRQLAGVRTTPAVRGALHRTVRAAGLVKSDESRVHQVTLKSAGYVESLFVAATGQPVRKGAPILSVYAPDLLAAQSEYLAAFRTARGLAAAGGATGNASANAAVRQEAEDLLSAARRKLELLDFPDGAIAAIERSGQPRRTITFPAPVSGYVTSKPVVAGQRIEPGTELYTVTDLSQVWIEADFYESESAYLKPGMEAEITLPYDPQVQLTGKVQLVYPVLDPASRTLKVRFEAPNPGLLLKPGMYANAAVQIESGEGILIPDNAVLDTGDRQLVFVEETPGRFVPRSVRLGLRDQGQVLVLVGLAEGEAVAVGANFLLDSESRIRAAFSGTAP
jgi:membrane fusion protein, copper/silver efflux system